MLTEASAYEIDREHAAAVAVALEQLRAAVEAREAFRRAPGMPAFAPAMLETPPAVLALLDDAGEAGEWLATATAVGLL
jgi:hypothetical protein